MNTQRRFISLLLLTAAFIMLALASKATTSNPSNQSTLAPGDKAPDFTLTDLDDNPHTLSDYTKAGNIVVLEWFNPNCPFVRKHYIDDRNTMTATQAQFKSEKIIWLRINSAYGRHPSAEIPYNKQAVTGWNLKSPILLDTSGKVGHDYHATRTPEFFIITPDQTLAYQGPIDDRTDAAAPGKKNYIQEALTNLLAGDQITTPKRKPYGCNIKYD